MLQEERIDKWLWATRIFKTRSIATDACKKGRVMVDGVCIKPSRNIKIGDTISVRKPPVTYTFEVTGLTEARIGAKLVPQYLINKTTKDQYELLDMVKISGFVNRQKGLSSTTKKEGRELAHFTEEMSFTDFDWDFDDDYEDEDDETK